MSNQISFKKLWAATGIALAANLVVFAVGDLAGATWDVGMPTTVSIAMVIGASVAPLLLGGAVAKLVISKWTKLRAFAAWAVLVFAIVGSPMGWISSNDVATGIALGIMHIFVGVAWFAVFKPVKE